MQFAQMLASEDPFPLSRIEWEYKEESVSVPLHAGRLFPKAW